MTAFFVTGTDTEVGKTWVSQALLHAAKNRGLRTIALKPIAAGCGRSPAGLRNQDALLLQEGITESLVYSQINPIALERAIAPHLAADAVGMELSVGYLLQRCRETLREVHDFALIEGAGGWRVPLNRSETLADLAIALQIPVILVVRMGLGCLNHALLTAEAIQRDGLRLAGWVANSIGPPMPCLEQNIASLQSRLPAPLLGAIPFLPEPFISDPFIADPFVAERGLESAAGHLNLAPLLDIPPLESAL